MNYSHLAQNLNRDTVQYLTEEIDLMIAIGWANESGIDRLNDFQREADKRLDSDRIPLLERQAA